MVDLALNGRTAASSAGLGFVVARTLAAESVIEAAADALGLGPDILVANCGGPPRGTFETTEIDDFRAALEVNPLSTQSPRVRGTPPAASANDGMTCSGAMIGGPYGVSGRGGSSGD